MTFNQTAFLILAVGGISLYGVALFLAWLYVEVLGRRPDAERSGRSQSQPTH